MTHDVARPARRSFLETTSRVGVLGAALSLLGRSSRADEKLIATPPDPAEPVAAVSGYHETEHIRKYYAAARYF